MTLDLWLAVAHHVLVFGLAGMLMAEMVLVRRGMSAQDAAKVARLDAGYGATAGLVIIAGVLRVIYGVKGSDYYLVNPWFWAKMACFALIVLLSIPPTLRFLAWRKAQRSDASFVPAAEEIQRVRTFLRFEVLLIVPLVAFAAAMARFGRF